MRTGSRLVNKLAGGSFGLSRGSFIEPHFEPQTASLDCSDVVLYIRVRRSPPCTQGVENSEESERGGSKAQLSIRVRRKVFLLPLRQTEMRGLAAVELPCALTNR